MGINCKLFGHKWENGICTRCHEHHALEQHCWQNGICSVCGKSIRWAIYGGKDEITLPLLETSPDGQAELINIALRYYEDKELRPISDKAAALITDEALLIDQFSIWAKEFESEKMESEWISFSPFCWFSPERFSAVSEDVQRRLTDIMRPHLLEIATRARHSITCKEAMGRLVGPLTKEEALRLVPLTENSVYVQNAIYALRKYSGDWRELITAECIYTLGSMMKHGKTGADEILRDLYKAGVRREQIRKYNGTVISPEITLDTDDDNYGAHFSAKKFFV